MKRINVLGSVSVILTSSFSYAVDQTEKLPIPYQSTLDPSKNNGQKPQFIPQLNPVPTSATAAIKETEIGKFMGLKPRERNLVLGAIGMFCLVVFGFVRYFLTGKQ